jgi:polysaccharide chain length determinant protein (PEP-CTERM system associated)
VQEALALILTYVRMVWRFRWVALGGAGLICAVGWLVVLLLPNQYEVTTKVFLDTRSMLRPLLRGLAVETGVRDDTIQMMRRTLLTRPNLETVARNTDMDLKAKTPEDFERLLDGLARQLKVSGTANDNIFVLSYTHSDARLATRVVESLLNIFVERSLGDSRRDTTKTREFLEQQIREYESRLLEAENRLKEFKRNNVGVMPGEGKGYFAQREQAAEQLAAARLQLKEAQNRRDAIQKQITGEEPTVGLGPPTELPEATGVVTPFDGRIEALQAKLDQLLLQYTDRHPDVIATRRLLQDLEGQRAEAVKKMPRPPPSRSGPYNLSENPIYQDLKVSLGGAEAEVAALEARVAEYEKREKDLARLVDTVPQVEADMTRLNRDYEVHKRNYDELVKRRESLNISDQAGKTTDEVQFNIVEPPRVPLVPAGPDRITLGAGVLVAGIAAGVGLAWLLAMLRPAVYGKEEFASLTDLPVLGTVSRIWTPAELRGHRLRLALFFVGCVTLGLSYGAFLAVQDKAPAIAARLAALGLSLG